MARPDLYLDDGAQSPPVGLLGSEADGGFADFVLVEESQAHDVTGSPLSDEQLACLPVAYGTAMGMLERAEIGAGETVLVTGASGGVGLALVELANARGANVLAVTSGSKAGAVGDAGARWVVFRDADGLATQVAVAGPVVPFDLRRLYLHNLRLIGSSMHTREHFSEGKHVGKIVIVP